MGAGPLEDLERRLDAGEAPTALLQDVAGPLGEALLAAPPGEVDARHPAFPVLRVAARTWRYDDAGPKLDADAARALVGVLDADVGEWVDPAARLWHQHALHRVEPSRALRVARQLAEAYPEPARTSPRLATALAAIATVAGAADLSAEWWERAEAAAASCGDAQVQAEVDLELARAGLLQAGGAPGRAARVLARVRATLMDIDDEAARLAWIDATLMHGWVLVMTGRPDEAREELAEAAMHVRPGSEFEAWLAGVQAFAEAADGDVVAARAALERCAGAETDTSSLELAAAGPARLLLAARRRDADEVERVALRLRRLEAEVEAPAHVRVEWRVVAAAAATAADGEQLAGSLLAEARGAFEPDRLPWHDLLVDVAAHAAATDRAPVERRELAHRAAAAGTSWPEDTTALPAPFEVAGCAPGDDVVEVTILDSFTVTRSGQPISGGDFPRRLRARQMLAMLVARDGRLERWEVEDAWWPAHDPDQVRRGLPPVLSAIRSALDARPAATSEQGAPPTRALVLGTESLQLDLLDADASDLGRLRSVAMRVREAREPCRARAVVDALAAIRVGDVLGGLGDDQLMTQLRMELRHEACLVHAAVLQQWLAHAAEDEGTGSASCEQAAMLARRMVALDAVDPEMRDLAGAVLQAVGDEAGAQRVRSEAFDLPS